VRARSYRFRILNGSVSRYFKFAMVREVAGSSGEFKGPSGSNVSCPRAVPHDRQRRQHHGTRVPFDGTMDLNGDGDRQDNNGILPLQGIAERYDIIVNFAKNGIKAGDKLYFVNLMEHDRQGPETPIALADVLSEKYKAVIKQTSNGPQWDKGDPAVGKFLQLLVQPYTGQDLSMDPAPMNRPNPARPKACDDPADHQPATPPTRPRSRTPATASSSSAAPTAPTAHPGPSRPTASASAWTHGVSALPQLASEATDAGFSGDGTLEVWKIKNGGNGWSHPVHVHFEEGVILSRDGKAPPEWEKWARKDVYRIGPEKTRPRKWKWPSASANSPGPTWSTATTPSMKTPPCCCAGTSSTLASSS
jgi:FtsP/CotA-like multicopper oxidase with cupredoxin domain